VRTRYILDITQGDEVVDGMDGLMGILGDLTFREIQNDRIT
jgi:hypothetical protein